MKRILPLLAVAIIAAACDSARTLAQGNTAGQSARDVRTEDGTVRVEVIARGLDPHRGAWSSCLMDACW